MEADSHSPKAFAPGGNSRVGVARPLAHGYEGSSRGHRLQADSIGDLDMIGSRGLRVAVLLGAFVSGQHDLWRECRELGVDITLLGTDASPYPSGGIPWHVERPTGIPVETLRPVRLGFSRSHHWWGYHRLGPILRQVQPRVLHVASEPWGIGVIQSLALRELGRTDARISVHGADNIWWHGHALEQKARGAVLRVVLPRLDGYCSWNEEGVSLAVDHGLRSSVPTAVLPAVVPHPRRFPAVSRDERTRLRESLGLPRHRVIVSFIGRLSPEKGVFDLLDAVRHLHSDAYVAIWGSGTLAQDVAVHAAQARNRIGFFGSLDPDEVPAALSASDIIVVPSRTTVELKEQFGRIVLEAMLASRPVIAYSTGSLPELVGSAGVLVDEGDVAALATAIDALAQDDRQRARLAVHANERAAAYHPKKLARALVRYWEEMARP